MYLLVPRRVVESGVCHKDYWLTDGLYGSFNCILYDDQKPQPLVSCFVHVVGAGVHALGC